MDSLLPDISLYDAVAVGVAAAIWFGYTYYADSSAAARSNLLGGMTEHRRDWMRMMLKRDNRMVDIQVMHALMRSGRFFASTAMLIIAGLLTAIGATDRAVALAMELPFAVNTSRSVWEAKLLAMVVIFIYAFFKFVWSGRQYNYCAIMIGAAPPPGNLTDKDYATGDTIAAIATLAARHANRGVRAYYFGLAGLGWFVHPFVMIGAVIWVALVLYRREFRSRTMRLAWQGKAKP
jgi:uncharacterized membrane protein